MGILKLGITGHPLEKTFSPDIFGFLFGEFGVRGEYAVFRPEKKNLAAFAAFAAESLDGFNVTSPYKREIIKHCGVLSREVSEIFSANAVRVEKGGLGAFNTDIYGFERAYFSLLSGAEKVCVFGSGGAASAVVAAVAGISGIDITVVSRNPEAAEKKMSAAAKARGIRCLRFPEKADVYVNATTVPGLFRRETPREAFYLDLNYPLEGGRNFRDGRDMLFYQAVKSFSLFSGIEIKKEDEDALKAGYGGFYD